MAAATSPSRHGTPPLPVVASEQTLARYRPPQGAVDKPAIGLGRASTSGLVAGFQVEQLRSSVVVDVDQLTCRSPDDGTVFEEVLAEAPKDRSSSACGRSVAAYQPRRLAGIHGPALDAEVGDERPVWRDVRAAVRAAAFVRGKLAQAAAVQATSPQPPGAGPVRFPNHEAVTERCDACRLGLCRRHCIGHRNWFLQLRCRCFLVRSSTRGTGGYEKQAIARRWRSSPLSAYTGHSSPFPIRQRKWRLLRVASHGSRRKADFDNLISAARFPRPVQHLPEPVHRCRRSLDTRWR